MSEEMTFGSFIRKKRVDSDPYISLRELARQLDLSAMYMSDVETNREYAPNSDILAKIANILKLDKPERDLMYDLAAKTKSINTVPADLPDYITANEYAKTALRLAKDVDATDTEWIEFIEKLKKRSKQQEKE